jgi:hypothetical protein
VKNFFPLLDSFKCRKCHAVRHKQFLVERFGFAQSLYYTCGNCNVKACARANLAGDRLEEKWSTEPANKTFYSTNQYLYVRSADFEANINMYLGTQQCGGGATRL